MRRQTGEGAEWSIRLATTFPSIRYARMRPLLILLVAVAPLLSFSQFMLGPEVTVLVQREPSPFAYGAGLRASYATGPRWLVTSSAGLTIQEHEKVDVTFGDPRALASGAVPQRRIGQNLHQRWFFMITAEWRSKDGAKGRRSHLAAGLGAGYHQHKMDVDHEVTYLQSGSQHRVQYQHVDRSMLILPYAGWRKPLLKGEFSIDAGGMLLTRRSLIRNFLPVLRTGLVWPLYGS